MAARVANLSVTQRLALIFSAGAMTVGSVVGIGVYSQSQLIGDADRLRTMEHAKAVLNHLDTREAELKVDAYRAISEPDLGDVRADLPEDVASVEQAVADLDALALPEQVRERLDAVRPDIEDFNAFVSAFVADAERDRAAVRERRQQIAERNSVVDDKLEEVHAAVDAAIEAARAGMEDSVAQTRLVSLLVGIGGVALLVALCVPLGRSITRPVHRIGRVLAAVAEGDLTPRADVSSRDELGRMAQALNQAIEHMRTAVHTIDASVGGLATASEELTVTSGQIAAGAEAASAQIGAVAAVAQQVSDDVHSVAAGSEQMSAAIGEIAQSAGQAAEVASQAVSAAVSTTETVAKLGASSAEIGSVIKTITSIAEQTNLLALNATIEAARAGDAGKGFAVVAGEVKDLAQETAKATDDIARRIEAIQADTGDAVAAIGEISEIISRINDYQLAISSAVEEQTATSEEMNRGVAQAASGTGRIAETVSDVAGTVRLTSSGVAEAGRAAEDLARMSADLRTLVDRFRV
ncbi:methyl-accepting chemotaxis protein [Planomonospora sp. ID82291]|uniref:methyl-accepting chemotaxis protein n=1 Tax=Planomonospora sp. ID82291 TaxID=2738136 RepID=UPI0018C431CE|nr:methyl-accepting chemotaxis protein [Planomonospora sp. ID82291]MBG0813462.1 HAMP domain-containing protein [Planomonospora sp. ID82291]